MIDPGIEYIPPPSMPLATGALIVRKKLRPQHIKQEVESEGEGPGGGAEDEIADGGGARGRGERKKAPQDKGEGPTADSAPRYAPLSLYEERLLLRRLGACPQALSVTPQAQRLHRKLQVRQAKRERGLPLLDLDQAVSATLSLVGGVYGAQGAGLSRQGPAGGVYGLQGAGLGRQGPAGGRGVPHHQSGPAHPRPFSGTTARAAQSHNASLQRNIRPKL